MVRNRVNLRWVDAATPPQSIAYPHSGHVPTNSSPQPRPITSGASHSGQRCDSPSIIATLSSSTSTTPQRTNNAFQRATYHVATTVGTTSSLLQRAKRSRLAILRTKRVARMDAETLLIDLSQAVCFSTSTPPIAD